ncbi:hypothetical protein, partial [Chryseobacterium sp. SIMBA_038]|uniref:hypothetical protein n=1 Tax=Chryseobacterium sp. SIMBA_038 TaxID=3085780 RepID=UPI00397B5DE5
HVLVADRTVDRSGRTWGRVAFRDDAPERCISIETKIRQGERSTLRRRCTLVPHCDAISSTDPTSGRIDTEITDEQLADGDCNRVLCT